MATLEVGGRTLALAPYKIGKLRRAGKFIDRINATAGALTTFEGMMEAARDMCEVLSIGLVEIDPILTADYLENELAVDEMPKIQACLKELMEESGLARKGEAKAPSEPPAEGAASPTSSDTSSTSSSARESKAEASVE